MSHIFKYHPDNVIYKNNAYFCTYSQFKQQNPSFPVNEGEYFSYHEGGLSLINEEGHHTPVDVEEYSELIDAINGLSV